MKKLLISAAVSLLTLGLIFQLVLAGAGRQVALWPLLRDVTPPLVALYLVCQLAQTYFRSERYRCLLRGCGEGVIPSGWHSFLATVARNAMVDLLPARAGELGYLALMNRGYAVGADTCLSSMVVSFLLDLVALAVVLAVAVAAPWSWNAATWPLLAGGALAMVVVSAIGALGLFALLPRLAPPLLDWYERRRWPRALALMPQWCENRRLLRWCSAAPRLASRALAAMPAFARRVVAAVARVRSRRVLLTALMLSLGVRFFKYGGLYALFVAVTRAHLPALAGAEARHVLPALLAGEGAAGLPIPALMGFGAYEGGATAAWRLMGFDVAAAALAMLALHIVSQSVDYLLGAAAGIAIAFSWRREGGRTRSPRRRLLLLAATAGLLAAAGLFAAWQWRALGKMGSLKPPATGAAAAAAAPEERRLQEFVARHRGVVVWSSNRHGNHDILLLEMPSGAIRRLTSHAHTETFPRLSPDGRQVLFSRSQQPWVSQRRSRPWDTWLLDLATGRERLVASNAFTAVWTGDGQGAVFQRNGGEVVLHTLANGAERTLLAAGRPPLESGLQLQSPDYDARSGRLAVTLRGARRMTAVYGDDGVRQRVSGGGHCQLAWLPGGEGLYSVGDGERQGNAIHRHWLAPARSELWLDLPEPFSHEYFPRLSRDGRVLVLGASSGGHEHDTADYEIFAWEVGTPPEAAVRLTFHTGNDCWPDIWLETGR